MIILIIMNFSQQRNPHKTKCEVRNDKAGKPVGNYLAFQKRRFGGIQAAP